MARAQNEHVQPQGVALQPGGLFDDPAVEMPPAPVIEWLDMPEPPTPGKYGAYPYDHDYVRLTGDGVSSIIAQWRTTRAFDRKLGGWQNVGFWTERNSGGRRIERTVDGKAVPFEPLGYARFVEE